MNNKIFEKPEWITSSCVYCSLYENPKIVGDYVINSVCSRKSEDKCLTIIQKQKKENE